MRSGAVKPGKRVWIMRTLFRVMALLGGAAIAPNVALSAERPGQPVLREAQYVAPAPGYPPGQYYAPGQGYPGNYAPMPPPPQYNVPQYYAPQYYSSPYVERRYYQSPGYTQPNYNNRFCARYPWRC